MNNTDEQKEYLHTEEAIGYAGFLLDDHCDEVTITEKTRAVVESIYQQLEKETDNVALILGTDKNAKALMSVYDEPMSSEAREAYIVLCEAACAINNGW